MLGHKAPAVLGVFLLTGIGVAWLQAALADNAAAPPVQTEKPEKPQPGERARQLLRQLAQYVDVDEVQANTTLQDELDLLSDRFHLPLEINEQEFAAIGVHKPNDTAVKLPKMKNVRLGTVLERLLRQIKGDQQYTGAYLVRSDRVELTTQHHQWVEAGADPAHPMDNLDDDGDPIMPREVGYFGKHRRMTTVVHFDFERRPLHAALSELADDTGYDIVIDPRVAEKAKEPVTLTLKNVWLDNAINVLTDLTGLDWVWRDRIIYVTSKEDAKQRRDKLGQRLLPLKSPD